MGWVWRRGGSSILGLLMAFATAASAKADKCAAQKTETACAKKKGCVWSKDECVKKPAAKAAKRKADSHAATAPKKPAKKPEAKPSEPADGGNGLPPSEDTPPGESDEDF
jgi:hypothetical protein